MDGKLGELEANPLIVVGSDGAYLPWDALGSSLMLSQSSDQEGFAQR